MPDEVSYWQVGSGSKGRRDYSSECLKYGLAFVGERYQEDMDKVEEGDYIVLRRGAKEIVAVGKAIEHEGEVTGLASEEKKSWLKDFDGWDLPAYCHVKWHKPPDSERTQLAQRAICQVKNPELQRQAREIFNTSPLYQSNRKGPPPTRKLADSELEEFLKDRLGVEAAQRTVSTIYSIRRLAKKYYEFTFRHWDEFKEHEIRTFLIIPLLLALGWKEGQIKIELNPHKVGVQRQGSIDTACFSSDYQPGKVHTNEKNCRFIIESKRFSSGITQEAFEQARDYAKSLPNCDLILVSNGYCYKAFVRNGADGFSERPKAYLNLLNLRESYPLDPDNVEGALRVMKLMLPETCR